MMRLSYFNNLIFIIDNLLLTNANLRIQYFTGYWVLSNIDFNSLDSKIFF